MSSRKTSGIHRAHKGRSAEIYLFISLTIIEYLQKKAQLLYGVYRMGCSFFKKNEIMLDLPIETGDTFASISAEWKK